MRTFKLISHLTDVTALCSIQNAVLITWKLIYNT